MFLFHLAAVLQRYLDLESVQPIAVVHRLPRCREQRALGLVYTTQLLPCHEDTSFSTGKKQSHVVNLGVAEHEYSDKL